jgi:glutamate synthase domain-containing protein 3
MPVNENQSKHVDNSEIKRNVHEKNQAVRGRVIRQQSIEVVREALTHHVDELEPERATQVIQAWKVVEALLTNGGDNE